MTTTHISTAPAARGGRARRRFRLLHAFTIQQIRPGVVLFTQREDFTGVAVPFYESWLHTDTLPMFRAMDAALAREVG